MNNKSDEIKAICQFCMAPLKGRSDKRFCNSACRSAFHNERTESSRKVIRAVNKVLQKNYQILQTLWEHDEREVSHHIVLRSGFNFNYFTSIQNLNTGATYFFCYDIGYSNTDEKTIRIIKKEKGR